MATTPGVYIEEQPGGPPAITGVPTSIAAFLGYTRRGPDHLARRILSYIDFERTFGGLTSDSEVSYAVRQFFATGGREAFVVRTPRADAVAAALTLPDADGSPSALTVAALGAGAWGNAVQIAIDAAPVGPDEPFTFTLTVTDTGAGTSEQFNGLTLDDETAPTFASTVVNDAERGSSLVLVAIATGGTRPASTDGVLLEGGSSGDGDGLPTATDLIGDEASGTGLYALGLVDLFNLLCIPDATRDDTVDYHQVFRAAMDYCVRRRAFLIVDPPPRVQSVAAAATWMSSELGIHDANGAAYVPRVRVADPLNGATPRTCAPSGTLAGLYARTDTNRGVWKAPAGTDATLAGVTALALTMTDRENGRINPLGLNALRTFPTYGSVAWGARTLAGADAAGSIWKYVNVRRLFLFLEESIDRGTRWAVFEPNGDPLWAQLRASVENFLHGLWRQGAFMGATSKDAYVVRCGRDTMTQDDIDNGRVIIEVGVAPLKPAEFVIIRIQQIVAQG